MAAREKTTIDHLERLNRVLVYIQDNTDSVISLDILSGIACLSSFHFHRIFSAHVGESVNGYVKRIRLEKAAFKLAHSDEPVTSIALAAGYETPSSFNKSFKLHFGVSPSEFRKIRKLEISSTAKKLNKIELNNGGNIVTPEIRELPEQNVLFVRKTGSYASAAEEAWSALMGYAHPRQLVNETTQNIGLSHDDPNITPEDKIRYDACITITEDVKPEGEIGTQTISGGKYAVFLHTGPYDGISETYNAIFSQWVPTSGESLKDTPCFEVYLNDPCKIKPEDLKTEICIPID